MSSFVLHLKPTKRIESGGITWLDEEANELYLKQVLRGLPGPGGTGANVSYQQTSAATVWTVPHNLNKKPAVTVCDSSDNEVIADVAYIDDNIVQVTHGTPLTGYVYCN